MSANTKLISTASALSLAALLLSAPAARAQTSWGFPGQGSGSQFDGGVDEKYLTIDHVEFESLDGNKPTPSPMHMPSSTLGADGVDVGTVINEVNAIINIGKELWQVVANNAPVVSTSQNSATAVPDGVHHWSELEGWSNPQTHNYQVSLKNGYGMTVVGFKYQLQFNSGGSQGGHGQYLANATLRATNVDVVWGYKFSADATVGDVLNVGTHQDPIAGVNLTLSWKVGTVLKQENASRTFFVRGDGQVDDLSQQ